MHARTASNRGGGGTLQPTTAGSKRRRCKLAEPAWTPETASADQHWQSTWNAQGSLPRPRMCTPPSAVPSLVPAPSRVLSTTRCCVESRGSGGAVKCCGGEHFTSLTPLKSRRGVQSLTCVMHGHASLSSECLCACRFPYVPVCVHVCMCACKCICMHECVHVLRPFVFVCMCMRVCL